ncbi:MAG: F0F1 ATP synthase subunit delta [Halothiobacillus sp.]
MLIDWFTVAAQVVNFLILVWLLKRFLYRPILDAIDAREQRIAAALADAEAKKIEAEQARAAFAQKNQSFDQARAALLSQATAEAATERLRLLDVARQESASLRARLQESLNLEQHDLNEALARRVLDEVFAIARKTLGDLAQTTLEERMVDVFLRRLPALDHQAKETLAKALKTQSDPALVRSAFALSNEQCLAIQTALNETFSAEIPLRFEIAPALISGIELTTNGQKLAWSIADYLSSLENAINDLPKTQSEPETGQDADA